MTKKTFFLIFLIFFLTSCSFLAPQEKETRKGTSFGQSYKNISVYFTKSKGPEEINLILVTRKIPRDESDIDAALKELFLGPTKKEEFKGIMSEIPTGTRLIKIEESEDDILVDVSGQFLVGGGAASVQLRYLQLYKTLKKIEPRKKVYLHVDGKVIKTISGEGLEVTQPLTMITDYTKKYQKIEDVQP